MADDQITSKYEALVAPEFKSSIPAHLLGKLGEQERYLVETLSKMEQQNNWLITIALNANAAVRDMDVRQARLELWKERLMSKWTLVFGAVVLIAPYLLKALFDYLFKKGP